MTNLLKVARSIALGACLALGSVQVFADDASVKEEVNKFAEENSKMREEHIQSMREIHLKHVNEVYDRKLAHSKEMGELWKQVRPGQKAANMALKKEIDEKQAAFKIEEEKFRKDFKDNVLNAKNKEFRTFMKKRNKEMKKKLKE